MALVPPEALLRRAPAAAEKEAQQVDARGLEQALRASVSGEVRFDGASRALYAHDASNYRRIPIGVVIPKTQEDVVAAVAACRAFGAPIVARGGGTGLAGQTVNEAIVIDFSKHLKRIVSIDPNARRARVELGVICDELDDLAQKFGLVWGPKPATHNRCCFGGMLANNCGGMHAQMNGVAVHNVDALDVLLYDGTRMHLGWTNDVEVDAAIARGGPEARVLRGLRSLRDRYADRIRTGYPKLGRRVSGYNLDQLLPDENGRYNLARVLVGSEGTLVTMLEATLELLPDPKVHGVVVLGFRDGFEAADAVPLLLDLKPLALEGMDDALYQHVKTKGGVHAQHLALLADGKGWLIVELGGATEEEVRAKIDEAIARTRDTLVGSCVYMDPSEQKKIFDAREGALGSTAFAPGYPDAWPGWEDSAVPPEKLGGYMRDLRALFDRYDYHPALYGHFGMGLIHCRVDFDLYTQPGVNKYRRFLDEAADLVVSYGGSLSGEHGDGQARAELLVKMFGPDLMRAMRELKAIFDPDDKMNPGKVVTPYPIVDGLKQWPNHSNGLAHRGTHFRYPDDGGSFARATLRCVGVGKCRREDGEGDLHDVMCPSYMVTHEEKHSTRGRAHLLFEMLQSDGPIEHQWRDEGVKEALDLCLACKGCRSDCPVNVDVAKHKAEFLSHYYEGRIRPRYAYAFGLIDRASRLAELAPGFANLATQLPGVSRIAKLAAGIAPDAKIPPFAPETFRQAFARRLPHVVSETKKVVLFADTFNDHFHPDTLMAGVRVLEATGYEVIVPQRRFCCGRPLYDYGMIPRARRYLDELLDVFSPYIQAELPVVALEPSCASVLKDELRDLMPERDDADVLRKRTMLLGEFLVKEAKADLPKLPNMRAIAQGHCHQKAVLDFQSDKKALEATGLDVEVLSSGCCGMAGAFGFVSETRDVGHAAGERVLLPRVRKERSDTWIIADGFSCREQIAQYTDRRALHLAEVYEMAIEGRIPPAGTPPEHAIRRRRERAVRGTMLKAGAAIAVAATLALATRRLFHGR